MASQVVCNLCFTALSKGPNRYLVQNKGEFSVQDEISDLEFVVHPTSQYICKICLRILQQRRNAKKKLQELNEKLLCQYRDNAATRGLSIKRKATESRSSISINQEESNSAQTAPENTAAEIQSEPLDFQPLFASTPQKLKSTSKPRNVENASEKTFVSVKVHWKSKESSKILPEDLESLGKMLCRGTYTQIARAAWRCHRIREQIVVQFLKDIDRECSNMCFKKDPSVLRRTGKEDILDFSLNKLDCELKKRTPLLRSVLMVACFRNSKVQRNNLYWMPAVCMASAICLKNRSPYLTTMQLVNTIFIQHSGLMVSILNTGLKLFIQRSHALVLYLHYYIKPYLVRKLGEGGG